MKKLIFWTLVIIHSITLSSAWSNEGDRLIKMSVSNISHQEHGNLIAVNFIHEDHWHTYWKNPGDSGLPTEFFFHFGDKTYEAKGLEWPVPELHIEQGNIWTYGYEGEKTFFLFPPENLLSKNNSEITLQAKWLICKDICIPGQGSIKGKIQGGRISWDKTKLHKNPDSLIKKIDKLPLKKEIPEGMSFALSRSGTDKELLLHFEVDDINKVSSDHLFIPYPSKYVTFKHEKKYLDNGLKGYIPLSWIGHYQEPEIPFPSEDNLKEALKFQFLVTGMGERPFLVSLEQSNIVKYLKASEYQKLTVFKKGSSPSQQKSQNFFYILIFAFLGGLILNLMPCVLPVISIKLFELIKHRNESKKKIIRHNSFYTFGVICSLLVLALVILILKSTGESIGWGFQLQSPLFIAVMIIVLFLMALNLFGLYEFRTPGGKALGNITIKDSYTGDFFSGVLATILSTPCSAPFLGTALTYAFTASTLEVFLTFFSIGMGLSSPFILTMIFPGLLKFFPKPGNWMNTLKYFLGLTLLLTIIWLLDVLHVLVDRSVVIYNFYPLLVLIFMAFFVYPKIKRKNSWLFLSLLAISFLSFRFVTSSDSPAQSIVESTSNDWSKWTPETITNAVNNNETIFIDFTAKWCLTCQVNKKVVLNTSSFQEFSHKNNIKLYRADWTKRDADITDWLAKNNVVGVPAYFLVKDGKLHALGETITLGKIKEYFN